MTEKNLWAWVRKNSNDVRYVERLYRIENKCMVGMPDVNYLLSNHMSGWIELKTKRILQPGQAIWLQQHWASGGYCFILLAENCNLFVYPGKSARDFERGMPAQAVFEHTKLGLSQMWTFFLYYH